MASYDNIFVTINSAFLSLGIEQSVISLYGAMVPFEYRDKTQELFKLKKKLITRKLVSI